jgi:hypothetical protein
MKMKNEETINKLYDALNRIENKTSVVYFLTYDTKNNPRAAVKYIYDLALYLNKNGIVAKLLVEDDSYTGVGQWLGDEYNDIQRIPIRGGNVELNIDDILVVPEFYSNVLEQVANMKCVKVMLIQQKDYIFDTLPIGSKWGDFGFDKVVTTTESSKKYILELFPESLVFVIPPIIGDNFKPTERPVKPYISISCRDRNIHKRLISEFYLKFPQLRWITFRDMVQMTYIDFAETLKECFVSVWVDDESTFGTFPLESLKCGVPVIGKIPDTEPDWLGENGMWTYDLNKIVEIIGTYTLSWLESIELTDEVKLKMKDTLLPYDKTITENAIVSIFNSLRNKRLELLQKTLDKLTKEETI